MYMILTTVRALEPPEAVPIATASIDSSSHTVGCSFGA